MPIAATISSTTSPLISIAALIEARPITGDASRGALVSGWHARYNRKATDRIVIGAKAGLTATVDDTARASPADRPLTIDPRFSVHLPARELAVLQAPMFEGSSLDAFVLFDDGWCPAELGVDGRYAVQALVVALVVAVLEESRKVFGQLTRDVARAVGAGEPGLVRHSGADAEHGAHTLGYA